jgi:hypothetical protein
MVRAIQRFIDEADALRGLVLEEEMDQLIGAISSSERAKQALLARTGLNGRYPATLEASGRLISVSRERVRQLERKLEEELAQRPRVWTPVLDRVLRTIPDLLPTTPERLAATLVACGYTRDPFDVAAIASAARLLGREVPFEYDARANTVAAPGQAAPVGNIRNIATRLVERWGATTLADVAAALQEHGQAIEPDLLRIVTESIPDFAWLDEQRGWFSIIGRRNRLMNHVEKILAVAGSISLGELRAGVGRHHRMKGFRPPREVLAALCLRNGGYARVGDRIIGGVELPDWRDVLGTNERIIVETLFDHDFVMRRDDLERIAVRERGLNRSSFYVYLTYSPVLERYAAGVYGLRGASVTASQVDALIPPRVRSQSLQDQGWTDSGEFWAAFRVSRAAETSGVLSAPAALRSVAHGRFELRSEDGRPVGTLAIEQNMWGLSPFFRRWGVEAGDYIVVRVDIRKRCAVVMVGDSELVLRYQQGE